MLNIAQPPPHQYPSVACPYCSWQYREWNESTEALVDSFRKNVFAHIQLRHPEKLAEAVSKYTDLNGHTPTL
jgi:hypothetical protein